MIDIRISYALDDSCQITLWAKGHHSPDAFRTACEQKLKRWDGREIVLDAAPVDQVHWRTVRTPYEESAVSDYQHIPSAPGRGAYPVTVLDRWLPLHDPASERRAGQLGEIA